MTNMVDGHGRAAAVIRAPGRIDWIDVTKGVGIVLVVIGHVWRLPIAHWIYRFHMPMYFMLSGMVFRPTPMAEFTAKRIRSLLIPYAAFLILITLVENAEAVLHGATLGTVLAVDIHRIPRDIYGGRKLGGEFSPVWFVTCLFISLLVYNALRRKLGDPRSGAMILVMALLFLLAQAAAPLSEPWDAAEVPLATFCLWLGEIWLGSFGSVEIGRLIWSPVTLVPLALAAIAIPFVPPLDMRLGDLGMPFVTVLVALAWSHVVILGCRFLALAALPNMLFRRLAAASLVIMFTHWLFLARLEDRFPAFIVIPIAVAMPYLLYLFSRALARSAACSFSGRRCPIPIRCRGAAEKPREIDPRDRS